MNIDLTITEPVINLDVSLPSVSTSLNTSELPPGTKVYDGTHEVTPLPYAEQELRTGATYVTQNIVVKKIPYFETSNEHGLTVYIGE